MPPGGFRLERLNDTQRAAMTDEQLLKTVVGEGNTRPVAVEGQGLDRRVIDTETGEVLYEFPKYETPVQEGASNAPEALHVRMGS
jgi:hypothetical protein